MATSYTSLLGLALPVTGELSGTWGDTVNNSITSLVDTAVAGTTTLSTDADVTLTTTSGASNQARQAIIVCSGARTALRTITAPAQSKVYVVVNNTTGGYGVKIVGAGPTTGVTVANGKTTVIAWNGSDFVEITPATAALATAATNIAGGSAGSLPYQSGASTTTFLGIGTSNYVLTSTGSAPQWTASTGTGDIVRATSPALVTPTLGAASATSVALGLGAVGTPSLTFTGDLNTGIWSPTADTIAASTAGAERIRINSIGNVGIGTNSITSIGSNITTTQVVGTVGAGVTLGSASYPTSTTLFTSGDGASATLGTYIAMPLLFATNSLERMRIDSSGNVGVNTALPASLFNVAANASASGNAFRTDHRIANATAGITQSGSAAPYVVYLDCLAASGDATAIAVNSLNPAAGNSGQSIEFNRLTSSGAVASADRLGRLAFGGTDGTNIISAAHIDAFVDGTPGTNDMPGRLVFSTTADGSSAPTERMRITNAGLVGIGTTSPGSTLDVNGAIAGTSFNKVTITAPASGSTLTIANGKTLTASNTLTLTGTDGSSVAFGTGGTVAYTGGTLAQFASTTSAQLAGVISDETGSGSLVFGTSPTIATPTITTSATVPLVIGGTGTTSTLRLRATSGVGTTGSDIIFQVGNNGATEGMRINSSGNVGVGLSSPVSRLNIVGGALNSGGGTGLGISTGLSAGRFALGPDVVAIASSTDASTVEISAGSTGGQSGILVSGSGGNVPSTVQIFANAAERMRIDSSGNVGIGTATPTINTTGLVLHIHSSTASTGAITHYTNGTTGTTATDGMIVGQWSDGNALVYSYEPNSLIFGTNTLERMRIDSSGNVGIGTTSPDALLTVNTIASFGDGAVGTPSIAHKGDLNTGFWFPAADTIAASTAGAERIRVDSSGNVMIATTTAAGRLNVYRASSGLQTTTPQLTVQNNAVDGSTSDGPGINFANATGAVANIGSSGNGIMWFSNRADTSASWSTRATIRSTGELWVGRTTALAVSGVTADHAFKGTTGDGKWVVGIENAGGGTPWGLGISYSGSAPNNTTQDFIWCVDTGGQRFSVRSNGGIANYQANDVNLSDIRTKTDIQPAESYLDKICAIPVKTFLYKDQTDEQRNLGVIAQDVEAVAPELVDVSGFGEVLEGEEPLKAVYQTDLQYALMKCIQEQQEIIKSLQKRVEDLESAKQ